MTSSRPYILRALYEWIVDNEYTPHIVVNAMAAGAEVPQEYVNSDGQIVLNVSPTAVTDLDMNNASVGFSARFGGVPRTIYVPIAAILGIYARENGQGMMFEDDPSLEPDPSPTTPTPPTSKGPTALDSKRPSLRIVK